MRRRPVRCSAAGLIADTDLHTRLAATLSIADLPTSARDRHSAVQGKSETENYSDRWLSRAFYIAGTRHKASFLTSYKSDPRAVAFKDLPVPLRLGATKPDWRAPAAEELAAWGDMDVPGNWESRGLPDFDGVVWFTRTLEWPHGSNPSGLTIGRVSNTSEVWVNGLLLTPQPREDAAARRRQPDAASFRPPTTSRPARCAADRHHHRPHPEQPQ